jgi:hypothetical protein
VSTTAIPDRFTARPDEQALQAAVVALEEPGFSVEVAGDLDAARQAVLARIPEGSPVMTSTSVTLDQTGIADAVNDGGGRREPARNTMSALDFATQAQQVKAIGGQPGYALGSVHALPRDGTVVIAPAPGRQRASRARGAAGVIFAAGPQKLVPALAAARERIDQHSAAGGRPRAGRLRAARPGREDPGDPRRTARPDPRRPHPPAGRLLNRRASPICPQAPGGVR